MSPPVYDFLAGQLALVKAGDVSGRDRDGGPVYADYDYIRIAQVGHNTVRIEKEAFLTLMALVKENKISEYLPEWHL